MEEGCLFWVYIGHGHAGGLDRVRMPDRSTYEILNCRDCAGLTPGKSAPIALFLACSTGAFDQAEPCLAEELLASPGGPVAVIAGSRMTMPYGLGIFADEALTAGLRERGETLGDVLRTAKARALDPGRAAEPNAVRKMLDPVAGLLTPGKHDALGELREHTRLMNLFGDPCLRLAHPRALTLTAPPRATPGETIEVALDAAAPIEAGSNARWEFRTPSSRARVEGDRRRYAANDALWGDLQRTYRASLRPELLTLVETTTTAPPRVRLQIPSDARGDYEVRLWLDDDRAAAVGAAKITVVAPPATGG
ncbi:MAG: C25 family cysteine peptidase [Pirellulales bacterium]